MPSKRNTVLAILAVILAIWGTSLVDWTRDVPHYPPDFAAVYGVDIGTGLPAGNAQPPRPQPDKPKPNQGKKPARKAPPRQGPAAKPGEVRITDLTMQPVTATQTRPVSDADEEKVAILRVHPDGRLRWNSFTAGSYEVVGDLCKKALVVEGFSLVIVPSHKTPWKYVYWALEVARENGVYNVGIGVAPNYDEKGTLLAQLLTPLPQEDYVEDLDCPTIEILLEEDKTGNIEYTVGAESVTGWRQVFPIISGLNSEYAGIVDENYSRVASKTPWVIIAPPETKCGSICRTLDVVRASAIYTVRFGGEFPARPK